MSILITGGAGFIGSHLVERLARDAAGGVTVLDNISRGHRGNLGAVLDRVRMIEGDIRDRDLLDQLVDGVDVIFHLAAQSSVMGAMNDPEAAFSSNVAGTRRLLECAQRHRVRRVVFTSSREVYGEAPVLPVPECAAINPKNAYGASKAAAEIYCRLAAATGLEVAILRLTNVYGPRDRDRVIPLLIERALCGEPLTLYGGSQLLDFVWIDVVVDALLKASWAPGLGGAVNVGSGRGCTLRDLADRIKRCAHSDSPVVTVESRKGEVVRFVGDLSRAAGCLGLTRPDDPLAHLPGLVAEARACFNAALASTLAVV